MRIMIVLGTRPEIIRLSRVIAALEQHCSLIVIHTGQNYDTRLSDIFFEELRVRAPNEYLGIQEHRFGAQAGQILARCEEQLLKHRPDRLLILGDTNSGLAAIVARRLGIPVYHMEAGNRCWDDRVPEEVNRRLIDHASTVLLPYTHRSKENLLAEGIPRERILVTGNPILEVLEHYKERIDSSQVLEDLELGEDAYFLLTLHRAENVDDPQRLKNFLESFRMIVERFERPVVCSLHPRTRSRLEELGVPRDDPRVRFLEPLGLFDFVRLEKSAHCVLSDSGTVQEECCIFGIPTVTLRDVTERPETVECGSNILSGNNPQQILDTLQVALENRGRWKPPWEYLVTDVSKTMLNIMTGFRQPDLAEINWRAGQ